MWAEFARIYIAIGVGHGMFHRFFIYPRVMRKAARSSNPQIRQAAEEAMKRGTGLSYEIALALFFIAFWPFNLLFDITGGDYR